MTRLNIVHKMPDVLIWPLDSHADDYARINRLPLRLTLFFGRHRRLDLGLGAHRRERRICRSGRVPQPVALYQFVEDRIERHRAGTLTWQPITFKTLEAGLDLIDSRLSVEVSLKGRSGCLALS